VRPLAEDDRFDLMLDGADEVDPALNVTKGGGGALLREKLLATLSREVAILVDPTKLVAALASRHAIPVEVVPFARPSLARRFADAGYRVRLRAGPGAAAFVTDNGNEILDLTPPAPLDDPAGTAARLRAEVGVVETGLFVGLVDRVFVGRSDGSVEERRREPPRRR
ncbi:Ribose 5-phosphate isomerase, partial [mine drainage metagenome]